ncbi:hypothetical protein AB1285_19905 [Microbacterium sp. NRRL B-14842]|uniref:hypothetical protein n=1 Tax=Microbacterium sp. NRRL B-14842 TaxID=3162881 RepID=UPI003D27E417
MAERRRGRWSLKTPRRPSDAGAAEIHVHPKDAAGRDSLAPEDVQRCSGPSAPRRRECPWA